jgi:phosphate transport system substrate-binding protein
VQPESASETLTLFGSTEAWPLLYTLGRAFQKNHPTVVVTGLDEHTSSDYVQGAIHEGDLRWGVIAGSPSHVWSAPLAVDALAVIVHPDNPLSSLTLTQLQQVFSGRAWRWSELGAEVAGDEIVVVTRPAGSGTRATFVDQVMRERPELDATPITTMAVLRPSGESVAAYVAEHPAAIGYVALGMLDRDSARVASERVAEVKALAIEGVAPGPEQVARGDYPLSVPLFFIARAEPTGVERQFLDFCLSPEGQRLVARGYVPVR